MHEIPDLAEFIPEFESGKPNIQSKYPLTRRSITGEIRKIVLFYYDYDGQLTGIRFYDAAGQMLYESAWKGAFTSTYYKQHEILLNEGERIVGFQSREYS